MTMSYKNESKIQQEIVMWFNNTYCLKNMNPKCCIFSVPNEGSNIKEQLYKKSLGMKSGVSDLIVVIPGKILFVECKAQKGKQRELQKDFQDTVGALGFDYIIVRSLEDFKNKIKELNLNP